MTGNKQCFLLLPLAVVLLLTACEKFQSPVASARKPVFDKDIAPILQAHCAECHDPGGEGATATGLLLDSYAALLKGSQYGPVITPGLARTSSLYVLITGKDNLTVNMPHGRAPLSDEEIETIRLWIDSGAAEN